MDPSIYETYYRLERQHWWFQARRDIILAMLDLYRPHLRTAGVLEIGMGTGGLIEEFERRGIEIEGHDASEQAVALASKTCKSILKTKKFPEEYDGTDTKKYGIILLLDVLEHIQDDAHALKIALRLLKPGGILLLTVPACKKMWSAYDVMSHHYRRYEFQDIHRLIRISDAIPLKVTCFSTFLFPFLFIVRKIEGKFSRKPVYRPFFIPGFFNRLLYFVFASEKHMLRNGNMPFGSSLMAVLKKK